MKSAKATPAKMAAYLGGLDMTKKAEDIKIAASDEIDTSTSDETVSDVSFDQSEFTDNPY